MLLQTRISNSEISQMKQMIHAWSMTSFRSRILNWLHCSKDENSWRISKLHDCKYARITFRWNWSFACKACKSSERFVDLMRFSSISISRREYIVEDSNFLKKHVVKRVLKMSLLEFYWNVSTRWIQIEFWIIQMRDHTNTSTTDSANLTCDIDVDIVEDFVESSRLRYTIQILIRYMMLNRKYRYFEALMLILHLLQSSSRLFDLLAFELLLFFFVVAKKRRSSELYWRCADCRNVIVSEII